jgi:cellulose synthase/poly-beta-1,6-N-acetylglucosamine synthase-like glycosyltransferase
MILARFLWVVLPVVLFGGYLILFGILALIRASTRDGTAIPKSRPVGISVVIPVLNGGSTITETVKSVCRQQQVAIRRIIIIDDHSTDDTKAICKNLQYSNPRIEIYSRQGLGNSKVQSYLLGLAKINDEYVALVDADTVLKPMAISRTLEYMAKEQADYGTCLIDPIPKESYMYKSISWDRLARQRVMQLARDTFGCANLPGCFEVVRRERFMCLLEDNFLEDLLITYKLISQGERVAVVPEVLAFELERGNWGKLILQRIRWAIGFVSTLPHFATMLRRVDWTRRCVLLSFLLLWYFLPWYLATAFLLSVVSPLARAGFLVVVLAYAVILIEAKIIRGRLELSDTATLPCFLMLFPVTVGIASICALFVVVQKRRLMFHTTKLYER